MGRHQWGAGQGNPNGAAAPMGRRDTLAQVLRDVGAGTRPWQAFVDALAAALGGAAVVLVMGDDQTDRAPDVVTAGIDERFRALYVAQFAFRDPWVERLTARPAGTVGFGYETLPRPLLMASRFYSQWMQPQGFAATPTIHAVVGPAQHGTRISLAVFRRADGPTLEIEDLAMIRALVPDLRASVDACRKRNFPSDVDPH